MGQFSMEKPPSTGSLLSGNQHAELAFQAAEPLARLGRKVAIICDMGVMPQTCRHRVSVNPFGSAVAAAKHKPKGLIYGIDNITHALIPEPAEEDDRNSYFRWWPRKFVEFGMRTLLKRSTALAIPGGLWALLSDPAKLRKFAAIEAEEGDPALKALAQNILEMAGHEHWPQHLEAAQRSVRLFSAGSYLNDAGTGTTTTHAELVKQGAIVFLVGPQAYVNKLGAYYALHIMAFIDALYGGAGSLRIIADEFTNAPLKSLVEALTTLRAYGCEVHMIAQSRSEIERKFGRLGVETIEENAVVKQWFGFSSFAEAERVSKALGEELAVMSSLGADTESMRLQTNMNLGRQRWLSAAELMAMPRDEQLMHVKGVGFARARTIGQQNIAPYCHLLEANPLEGRPLAPDPWITLTTPDKGVPS
ncbi:type IV secretory system conjugative DNA transfer family protein [Mesorhizobium yinganensis]|uniref:type IV secretory system conjugative DNA transfer family protein n=1 Tax=Mesorhizobium yinganensis TaxID=3157707 RepID=UPI0032B82D86